MATIALYADKINQMPSLLNGVKDSIGSLKEELKDLQKTALRVDSGICDLSEVAESVRAATMIEENRVSAIEEFQSRTEEFIRDAVRIDEAVAEAVGTQALPISVPSANSSVVQPRITAETSCTGAFFF